MSSGLNSLAAVTVKDIVKIIQADMSDERETKLAKIIGKLAVSTSNGDQMENRLLYIVDQKNAMLTIVKLFNIIK